jgi:hypothetical protein
MATVLQTRYAPGIAVGVEGQIADTADSEVGTRVCETAAGISFGKATSFGTGAKGIILGGTSFIGLSVRDITLSLAPVDPLSNTPNPLDAYGRYTNVAFMSRGHMWVKPQALVAPGESVFYETTGGVLTNSASGTAASGWVRFSQQPVAGNTLVINGATLTFVASGATGDQVNIGPTLGDTVAAAAAVMDASATAGFAALTFRADPPAVGGGSGADTILIQANAVGVAGNALAITSGPVGMTKSGATLAGGTAAATAISAGRWITGGIAGQLAIVSLGIQI